MSCREPGDLPVATSSEMIRLTGASRAATSRLNTHRNYVFGCQVGDSTRTAHGCNPTIGVVHAEQRNRNSFVFGAVGVAFISLAKKDT